MIRLLTAAPDSGKGAARNPHLQVKVLPVANPELGVKQLCPNCQAKFYDLNRRPARCPKCETEFDPEEVIKVRKVRGRGVVDYEDTPEEGDEDQVKAKADADEDEEEEVTAPEIDEAVDEPPLVTDDDDADEPNPDAAPGMGEADADEVLDDDDDDSVPFIEEDGDDFEEEIEGIGDDDDEDQ